LCPPMTPYRGGLLLPLLVAGASAFPKPDPLKILSRRINSQKSDETIMRCLLLDTMVPRQRITLQFGPPVSHYLTEARADGQPLGILGMDKENNQILRCGVEARIESMSPYRASHGYFSSHSTPPLRGFTAQDTTLVGGRRFEVVEVLPETPGSKYHKPKPVLAPWPPIDPVFLARVRWLEMDCGTAAATLRAQALEALVTQWLELVRTSERERFEGHLHGILADLGPMPPPEEADELCFWAGALLNPLPKLGVAKEVRAALLDAPDCLRRVQLVEESLLDSIERMKRLPAGPIEVEQPDRR
jgi:hypothetical protein